MTALFLKWTALNAVTFLFYFRAVRGQKYSSSYSPMSRELILFFTALCSRTIAIYRRTIAFRYIAVLLRFSAIFLLCYIVVFSIAMVRRYNALIRQHTIKSTYI